MTRPWRTGAGVIVLLAALSTVVGTSPAAAATTPTVTISDVALRFQAVPGPGKLDLIVTARKGTAPVRIEANSLQISATPPGQATQSLPYHLRGSAGPAPQRAAMLLLDTSDSMDGHGFFGAAKAAAEQFIDAAPSDLKIGLVTFGDPAVVRQRPTLDRKALRRKIEGLTTDGNTAMYQAVTRGVAAMADIPLRSLVMLTDGKDDDESGPKVSATTAKSSLQRTATRAEVEFEGILIGTKSSPDDISQIAGMSHVARDQDGLADRLNAFSQSQASTYDLQQNVEVDVPAALAGQDVSLRVTARIDGQLRSDEGAQLLPKVVTTQTLDTVAQASGVVPDRRLTAVTTPIALVALVALFAGLAVLVFLSSGALVRGDDAESEVVRRLSFYSVNGAKPQTVVVSEQSTKLGDNPLTRSAVGLVDRLTTRIRLERSLDSRLEAAGLPLRTAEWALLHVGSAVGLSFLFLIIARGSAAGLLLGLVVGLALPWAVLVVLQSRRERKFMGQLPDTLQLLAGSLAAGYSLPQAMDSVVRESEPPISAEFNRALVEARLGMLAEDALDGIASRTASQDFEWIVMAIRIQREVGGNLAALLTSVADTLRERERLRRQVQSLSAEGRLSGLILGALPIVFGTYLALVRPSYIRPLYTTPMGVLLLVLGCAALLVGGFWMSRVIKVEV